MSTDDLSFSSYPNGALGEALLHIERKEYIKPVLLVHRSIQNFGLFMTGRRNSRGQLFLQFRAMIPNPQISLSLRLFGSDNGEGGINIPELSYDSRCISGYTHEDSAWKEEDKFELDSSFLNEARARQYKVDYKILVNVEEPQEEDKVVTDNVVSSERGTLQTGLKSIYDGQYFSFHEGYHGIKFVVAKKGNTLKFRTCHPFAPGKRGMYVYDILLYSLDGHQFFKAKDTALTSVLVVDNTTVEHNTIYYRIDLRLNKNWNQ